VRELVALETPAELKARIPARDPEVVARGRQAIRDVLHGRDDRLIAIVGPCSIHDTEAALEYARRLLTLRAAVEDQLVIVMRTYFEKPRTTVGWKGLVYDPHLDGSEDIPGGLEIGRRLLAEINAMGLPCAVEVLDPITPQYFADLIAWSSVGARTVESQIHRQLASGLSMPVGFKNATNGAVDVAAHAMTAAARPHTFFGVGPEGDVAMVRTRGNPDVHIVLRGGTSGTNYDAESVADALDMVQDHGVARPVMIDCSHGNSLKDHRRQPEALHAIVNQVRGGQRGIAGFMLESHLHEGRQDWKPGSDLAYGVSITDACLAWEATDDLLRSTADSLR
jgi:3-deoxy-7-phosphoheptulonate synthase